jgi:uncharacterized protein YecE (DUF72 family)
MKAVEGWFEETPDEFRFAWKASRFITHWKRLSEKSRNSLELLETRLAKLRHKVGPILFQLPPRMAADRERLSAFLKMLNPERRYSFEFRHPSWYEPAILELLREHDIALCLSDHADAPAPRTLTASFAYIRNHGPTGRYHGNYPDDRLKDLAGHIARWSRERRDIWVFFDNDVKSAAPQDAERLLHHLARRDGPEIPVPAVRFSAHPPAA